MKKLYRHFIVLSIFFFSVIPAKGAITSVVLTPESPTTMSTGLGYYLAGNTYVFTVNVIDPAATAWADITDVNISLNNSTNITAAIAPSGPGAQTIASSTGPIIVTASIGATDTWNNFTVTFNVTIRWNTAESVWAAGRLIRASATSSNTLNNDRNVSYGVCSSVRALNLAMTGEAADGRTTRYHQSFDVTADEIVYNIPGATNNDEVRDRADSADAEIGIIELRINGGVVTGSTNDGDDTDGINIDVPSTFYVADDTAARAVAFLVNMTTAGGPVTISNPASIRFNSIRVTDITFFGGEGIDNEPSASYRCTNVSGTQVSITADMVGGNGPMIGNTYIQLRDSLGNITTVTIANGQNTGTAVVNTTTPNDYAATIGTNNTQTVTYIIYNVYGGSHCSPAGFGQYANDTSRITNTDGTHTIYWDNIDPPGNNTPSFTTQPSKRHDTTAIDLNIYWNALTATAADADFDTYKIYYREENTETWTIIDRNTSDYTNLGTITTNSIRISGLKPLTSYEYIISAVDIFGNEVADANRIKSSPNPATLASSVTITITDSITIYEDSSFDGDPNPATTHRLRKSAIRADFIIVTSGTIPTKVEMILADNEGDTRNDPTDSAPNDISQMSSSLVYSIECRNTGPNQWTGFIPSEHPLMVVDRGIRFILKITYNNGIAYIDHDAETESPIGLPQDNEWRFYVYMEPKFKPWPTRILNNVITDKNPVAYPAYYLTDDAYVTITAYDIKGRVVSVLLEDAFRKTGQNIKEKGWKGTNKYNKKLGVGLYYIRFKAKRASDGKVILDKFKKVVMAR